MPDTATETAAGSDTSPGSATSDFAVRGMTCGSCANRLQRTLGNQPGVERVWWGTAHPAARVAPSAASPLAEPCTPAPRPLGPGP